MKRFYLLPFIVGLLTFQSNAQTSDAGGGGTASVSSRAAAGDKVWVIINHVKADKRDQFEKFVNEVFWPMSTKLTLEEQKLFKQTRVLYPTKAEADGTYSYLFLMDPLIPAGDYNIENLLKRIYGEDKWMTYGKMFDETQARDQTLYEVVQSKY